MDAAWFFAFLEGRCPSVEPVLQASIQPADQPFERFAPIFDHMPTIDDLLCCWCPKLGTTGIFPRTISDDPLHPRMSAEPLGKGFCGPVRQHIDWALPLPIDVQSPLFHPTAHREIINAQHLRDSGLLCSTRLGEPQEGIRTDDRSHRFEQTRSWFASTVHGKDAPVQR